MLAIVFRFRVKIIKHPKKCSRRVSARTGTGFREAGRNGSG